MFYVYIDKNTNLVKSVVQTDLAYDKNSNLHENQYCVEVENLNMQFTRFSYKYENGNFTELPLSL